MSHGEIKEKYVTHDERLEGRKEGRKGGREGGREAGKEGNFLFAPLSRGALG